MTPEIRERKRTRRRRMFAGALIIVLVSLTAVCQAPSLQNKPGIMSVFSDFVFVGSGPAVFLDDGTLDRSPVLHGTTAQPPPQEVTVGVQYVFHRRLRLDIKRFAIELLADPVRLPSLYQSMDVDRFALEVLPARLRAAGFEVIESPETTGFAEPFIGGPLFWITFSDGTHEGLIYNSVDRALVKDDGSWETEDYILVYLR